MSKLYLFFIKLGGVVSGLLMLSPLLVLSDQNKIMKEYSLSGYLIILFLSIVFSMYQIHVSTKLNNFKKISDNYINYKNMIKNFNCTDKEKLEYLEKYTDDVFDNISKNL